MQLKQLKPRQRRGGFTLVEIMIVVSIIGLLLNIAAPTFIGARETSRAKSCTDSLKQLDYASQMYAIDYKMSSTAALNQATWKALLAPNYIRNFPTCPEGGTYTPGVSLTVSPTCSIPAANPTSPDYQPGGKYYHGL